METNGSIITQKRLWLVAVVAVIAMVVVIMFMTASPAGASWCVDPSGSPGQGNQPADVHTVNLDSDEFPSGDKPHSDGAWSAHNNDTNRKGSC